MRVVNCVSLERFLLWGVAMQIVKKSLFRFRLTTGVHPRLVLTDHNSRKLTDHNSRNDGERDNNQKHREQSLRGEMVPPTGVEPATVRFVGECSIH